MWNPWLHRYAVLLAACTLCLVVAGALVTSNEAGLSVPDWPLSYGKLMPEMTGGIVYEHGHRMIATTVGILTIVLAVWLWRADPRPWMRKLGWTALGLVIAQGVLGGITVLFLLPKAVSVAHASLAQIFFSTTMAIAMFTSRSWLAGGLDVEDQGSLSLRTLAWLTPVILLCQLALGAAYRHNALGLVPHVVGAAVATGAVLYFTISVLAWHNSHRQLHAAALALVTITFCQVFLGVAAYMSRVLTADAPQPIFFMVVFTVLHVAVGALTLAVSVLLGILVLRYVQRPAMELVSRRELVAS